MRALKTATFTAADDREKFEVASRARDFMMNHSTFALMGDGLGGINDWVEVTLRTDFSSHYDTMMMPRVQLPDFPELLIVYGEQVESETGKVIQGLWVCDGTNDLHFQQSWHARFWPWGRRYHRFTKAWQLRQAQRELNKRRREARELRGAMTSRRG